MSELASIQEFDRYRLALLRIARTAINEEDPVAYVIRQIARDALSGHDPCKPLVVDGVAP